MKILGFLFAKIGLSCSSTYGRSFIDGWFLGAGIKVAAWAWQSKAWGKYEYRLGLVLHTRPDFKFGHSFVEYDCRVGRVFSFWYGAIIISHY